MDDVKRMLIEHACCRLIQIYAFAIDHRDVEAFVNIFTKDASYKLALEPKPLIGHEPIRKWLQNYPPDMLVRHVPATMVVDVIDDDNAKGLSYTAVYKQPHHKGPEPSGRTLPRGVVEYYDRFVRTPDGWRIKSRENIFLFFNEDGIPR
ncbi:MAG: nuclear transport factor 2 family protein [Alphaproteobacteria bacterium]